MNNIDLIRKAAWLFHHKTHLNWDELFQEAALAYYEALKHYDPKRGRITTFMWHSMMNRLKDYLKKQQEYKHYTIPLNGKQYHANINHLFESLSREAQQVAQTVLKSPRTFSRLTRQQAQQRVLNVMRRKGHSMFKICVGISDLKLIFNEF